MNRIYTAHLPAEKVQAYADAIRATGLAIQDVGADSVSYRVSGSTPRDRDVTAVRAMPPTVGGVVHPEEVTLTTGLGVHKRIVWNGPSARRHNQVLSDAYAASASRFD